MKKIIFLIFLISCDSGQVVPDTYDYEGDICQEEFKWDDEEDPFHPVDISCPMIDACFEPDKCNYLE